MLEKNVTTTGKIFTDIDKLIEWDKNPRSVEDKDLERLKRQMQFLGQYKPLLVTEDGIVVGGNMRLRVMRDLKITEVWITELAFGKTESDPIKFKAIIDGEVQEREYDSIEQIMIEYALSDNDGVGAYDQQALHELTSGYAELIPQGLYKLELAPPTALETFNAQMNTGKKNDGSQNKAIDPKDTAKDLNMCCPRCGFEFKGDSDTIEVVADEENTEVTPEIDNATEQPQV